MQTQQNAANAQDHKTLAGHAVGAAVSAPVAHHLLRQTIPQDQARDRIYQGKGGRKDQLPLIHLHPLFHFPALLSGR